VLKGEARLASFKSLETGTSRRFCKRCGTPIFYERSHAPRWINIPRSLFPGRTGREPRYHLGLAEAAEWEYRGEFLRMVSSVSDFGRANFPPSLPSNRRHQPHASGRRFVIHSIPSGSWRMREKNQRRPVRTPRARCSRLVPLHSDFDRSRVT
jgi:hypothetical protein